MLLTKHENATFTNQTIYVSGQAFIRCTFIGCTMVLRETIKYLEGCSFDRCNWHVDWVLLWGSPESLQEIKGLISMIERAQQMQLPSLQQSSANVSISPSQSGAAEPATSGV